jgi:hypothetical protein
LLEIVRLDASLGGGPLGQQRWKTRRVTRTTPQYAPISTPNPCRRCGARPQPGRWPGHEHRHAGGRIQLAWKLALVVWGTCDEPLLDSYSPESSKVGDAVLKATERLTRVGTLRNPLAQTVRNLAGHVIAGLGAVSACARRYDYGGLARLSR